MNTLNEQTPDLKPLSPDLTARITESFTRLTQIMAQLRNQENGCAWDLEQTLISLKPHLIEEAYEVLEAIESGDVNAHCEELGDLLLQIAFQARITEESGHFDFAHVAKAIGDKLVRRHPHIFEAPQSLSPEQVKSQWEQTKKREKPHKSALDGIPRALPGLTQAYRAGEKAAGSGFDFEHPEQAFAKVREEIEELAAADSPQNQSDELGDALFALVNYARLSRLDPEEALRQATKRFSERFKLVETWSDGRLLELSAAAKEQLWQKAKAHLQQLSQQDPR